MSQLFRKSDQRKRAHTEDLTPVKVNATQKGGLGRYYHCNHTLITPAGRLIYSVFYSILHLHKMLVFSCWDYNHNKLFAKCSGASQS